MQIISILITLVVTLPTKLLCSKSISEICKKACNSKPYYEFQKVTCITGCNMSLLYMKSESKCKKL